LIAGRRNRAIVNSLRHLLTRSCGRRKRISRILQSLQGINLSLLDEKVHDKLEQNGKEGICEVGVTDKGPIEAVQESDVVVDNRGRAGVSTIGTR